MKQVYHGALQRIEYPLVGVGRENLDFGRGFYVTDIREQAVRWARIKGRYMLDGVPCVNVYDLDYEGAVASCRYLRFARYDASWLRFIVHCRMGQGVWQDYDIVEGGVANDRVIDTVENYISGMVSEEFALAELSRHQPNNQICILNQTIADKYLHFVSSEEIKA